MEDIFDFYNFINLKISEKEKLFEYKNNLKPSNKCDFIKGLCYNEERRLDLDNDIYFLKDSLSNFVIMNENLNIPIPILEFKKFDFDTGTNAIVTNYFNIIKYNKNKDWALITPVVILDHKRRVTQYRSFRIPISVPGCLLLKSRNIDNYDLKFNIHDFYVSDPVLEEIYNYIYDYKLNLEISLLDFGLLI